MVIAAVQLKKRVASASIFGIVICKFSYWQELGLIILFKIDENLKVSHYSTILPLGLAICL